MFTHGACFVGFDYSVLPPKFRVAFFALGISYWYASAEILTLLWRHNGRDDVSNHQPTIVYSTVHVGPDQRKHQNSESLAFVRGIHRWPVNSPHKWSVTRNFVSILWRRHAMNYMYGFIDRWGSLWYHYISITKQTMPKHFHSSWVRV